MKNLLFITFALSFLSEIAVAQRAPDGGDVPYGSHPRQKLDYWKADTSNSPIILLVHGGGWRSGDKRSTNWRNASQLFYEQGFAVVNINYILSVDAEYEGFPMKQKNIACAVAWTKENAQILNGDPSSIVLFGNSAGAHLVSLHGLNQSDELLNDCSFNSSLDVYGVIALSGMFGFDLVPQNNQDSKEAITNMVLDSVSY